MATLSSTKHSAVGTISQRATQLTGWLALLALGGAVASGLVLSWYYLPTPALAHASLVDLAAVSPLAGVMRRLHQLCSHLALAVGLLHLAVVLAAEGSTRAWRSGLIALGLIGTLAFTGRILPWDQHAAAALQMTESFLGLARAGEVAGPGGAQGIAPGAHSLSRVLLLHLASAALLIVALLAHNALRRVAREGLSRTGQLGAVAAGGALLLAALLLGPPAPGPAQLAGGPPMGEVHAEWYLRWVQWLALRDVSLARAALLVTGLLALATPAIARRWPRAPRLAWIATLALTVLFSLLPAS